jgi:zinc/manganese transport system substrate-binding protein
MFKRLIFLAILLFSAAASGQPKIIHIVAAENFYGDIARQIGGDYVQVFSIMKNPNQDPHLFSATMPIARAIAEADIIVYNGIGYDPWMENLLSAHLSNKNPAHIIIAAQLIHKKPGDNPHIWYGPRTMAVYAQYLYQTLLKTDPAHAQYYQTQYLNFEKNYSFLEDTVHHLKNRYQNLPVIATEPVFNDMAVALGLKMQGYKFQLSIMNSTSPSVQETKNFEDALKYHRVKLLIYNKQVSNPLTRRMQILAKTSHIPAIGVTETQPPDKEYIGWMDSQLKELDKALSHGSD